MRVSFVVLALIMPVLFSSLLTFSSIGEEKRAITHSNKDKADSSISFVVAQWELSASDVLEDDVDDDGLSLYALLESEHSGDLTSSATRPIHFRIYREITIRGPPSFS
ncbi:hypothetical protein [Alteromonas sp. 009811495]|uniref:hypothetical protein n=1 Tax=Alteromonas sp. 009811495 TaxID=3002962 RepID=UPI00237DFD36|nr:hypothetical protein [Alteromonas sp. 009811495]MEC8233031.1 hypothetical protein [Pseudomonadota bacterium]WDT85917.1 hypothetical protein OZ660_18595 [Alteromonas sp. 009811495]